MTMRALLLALAVGACPAAAQLSYANAQIDWVRSHGGFFSPKLELKLLDESDPDSTMGVFATEDIQENETLMMIPSTCFLTSEGTGHECDTTRNLVKQRELKSESKYAPYIDYVFRPLHRGQVPSEWSDAGKALLKTIIGRELPPYDRPRESFQVECNGTGDPREEEAWTTVIRRSTDDVMVPLMDMLNHRNGNWTNVNNTSVQNATNVTVFAIKDIAASEQLYMSYNEPDHGLFYVLPYIFNDFGFVEQYPRRWIFSDPAHYEPDLVFELDQDSDTKDQLHLKWLSREPSARRIMFLRGHLTRLEELDDYVSEQLQKIESNYERNSSIEYYQGLIKALKHALWASEDKQRITSQFDELSLVSEEMYFSTEICDFEHSRRDQNRDLYQAIDGYDSFYQNIEFFHSKEFNDTCLYMDRFLHTCTSFRPHYHETFIHYPARFLDEVKRVAFIGGGDNMIVHELLKYPSLELALGLELDQSVVRKSFKNMGTQPHFDDERVEWWFGDGAKSLLALPNDYYGSFDLVLLDLTQEVTEVLNVTNGLSINDAAMLLLRPGGITMRNEDWNFATYNPFTDYSVDLVITDLPITCHQIITMGSNDIDFITKVPKDHHINTVYLKAVDKMEDRFDIWFNYRKSSNRTNAFCKKPSTAENVLKDNATMAHGGVLMIIEAEDASLSLESPWVVRSSISTALSNSGLLETSFQVVTKNDGYELVFALQEGYVVARAWPKLSYCAFDLMLWSKTEMKETAKAQLATAVGSRTVSAYRIVASGMPSVDAEKQKSPLDSDTNSVCKDVSEDTSIQDLDTPNQNTIDTVLSKSAAFLDSSTVLVLCGDPSTTCKSLEVLTDKERRVIPLWTCPSLSSDTSLAKLTSCQADTMRILQGDLVAKGTKIKGIVIDSQAPRAMGQVLHKILSTPQVRRQLLVENHVAVYVSNASDAQWRRALLDRFRTNFTYYDPSYRAEVVFEGTDLELGIYGARDYAFYSHLMDVVKRIESETGLTANVQHVRNAYNNYHADLEPTKYASHNDYDLTDALQQYKSQQCLAKQSLVQFRLSLSESLNATTIQKALHDTILNATQQNDNLDVEFFQHVGDGCILVVVWSLGRVVVTWDGAQHLNMNLQTSEHNPDHHAFASLFQNQCNLRTLCHDEMPRGIGRVVNFASDYQTVQHPMWAAAVVNESIM